MPGVVVFCPDTGQTRQMLAGVVHGGGGGAPGAVLWLIIILAIVVVIAFFGTAARGVAERLPSFLTSMPGSSSDNSLNFGTVILGSLVIAILIILVMRN